jgi:alkylhydroperoxidase family enzyme
LSAGGPTDVSKGCDAADRHDPKQVPLTMARIAYPMRDALEGGIARILDEMPRSSATDMLAHSPLVAEQYLRLSQAQFTGLELSLRHRELLILTVASHVQCEYEYRNHVPVAESVGVEPGLAETIWRREVDASKLSAQDQALLTFVDAVLRSPEVAEGRVAQAQRHFSDREIVEILVLIGFYWGFGRLCTVLDLEIGEPDGLAATDAVANLSRRD